jgi:hypothetical protein
MDARRPGADPALGGAELDEFSISVGATDLSMADPEITERHIDPAINCPRPRQHPGKLFGSNF